MGTRLVPKGLDWDQPWFAVLVTAHLFIPYNTLNCNDETFLWNFENRQN